MFNRIFRHRILLEYYPLKVEDVLVLIDFGPWKKGALLFQVEMDYDSGIITEYARDGSMKAVCDVELRATEHTTRIFGKYKR